MRTVDKETKALPLIDMPHEREQTRHGFGVLEIPEHAVVKFSGSSMANAVSDNHARPWNGVPEPWLRT